ncbi:MAG: nickel-responsive transcriptional regulator NikR [Deltaproteobacteria bacterium]|nr:nickel-responsive transcriptional regulator NikR [Deltaproteobacteria bacterium]
MSSLIRFGISLDKSLLNKFDKLINNRGYTNRSEALRDLIREELVRREWLSGEDVAGTITLVYDHHTRELTSKLINIQHKYHDVIISTQHIHLDHQNCLEVIVVKGNPKQIEKLASQLKATRGVKHSALTTATTGKNLI